MQTTIQNYIESFPKMNNTSIAKVLINNEKEFGTYSVDWLRKKVGYVRNNKQSDIALESIDLNLDKDFSLNIPKGDNEDYKFFDINEEDCLVINDVHIPYHDKTALEIALEDGYKSGVKSILHNGDLFDFYSISRWSKIPDKSKLKDEISLGIQYFESLRKWFPDTKIYFKLGNHEDRLDNYIISNSPELYGLKSLTLESILELERFDIQLINSLQPIKFGKLNIVHGHEGKFSGTINVTRGAFLKVLSNVMFGHLHKSANDTYKNIDGNIIGSYAVGCLCHLHPDYAPINQWSHGYAKIKKLDEKGSFKVDNIKLHKYQKV